MKEDRHAYLAAEIKSGSQRLESSRIKPETTGSPITRCPASEIKVKTETTFFSPPREHVDLFS